MLLLLVDHLATFENHLFSFVSSSGSVRRFLFLYLYNVTDQLYKV